jgi:hypothetical protein
LAVGLKVKGNSTLSPGLSFTGTGKLPSENSPPCSDLEVIFSVFVPVFES